MFDPNAANIQRQHARGQARGDWGGAPLGLGDPRAVAGQLPELGLVAGQLLERGDAGQLIELGLVDRRQAKGGKLGKLLISAAFINDRRRLPEAFQHRPSNMAQRALQEWPKTANPQIRGDDQVQLLDQAAIEQLVDDRHGPDPRAMDARDRDRRPKLLRRAPTLRLLSAISGL